MALTAGCMTLLAVVFKSFSQRGTLFQVASPGSKNRLKSAERCVEANLIHMGDIFVAGVAICLRRVGYQPHVGDFFIFFTAVAAVTDNAANLTVGALDKLGIFQEDLLPYLQRR